MSAKRLWDKGYSVDEVVEEFTVGNDYLLDMQLVKYDCIASIAHARMLGKIGVLKKGEVDRLVRELERIMSLWREGKFVIRKGQEDVHTAIENELTARLGDLGKKIHTGRSRNDQVLTALRLCYKDNLNSCIELAEQFIFSVKKFSSVYGKIALPGYTHMRKAMPSSVGLWSGAFVDSMEDNILLLKSVLHLVDQCPLGTGAGYGSPLKLDRKFTAKVLGFDRIQENPIYAQISRGKFESAILDVLSQVMFDINKLATDLALFSMPEFGYYILPDAFTTGSSMMPQKKNPDVLELLRAKYHVVVAYETEVKGLISNLPSGYNRDFQLTKEPVLSGFLTTEQCLNIARHLFENLKVDKVNCKKALTSEVYATQKVYELVKKGVPFRDAYRTVSKEYADKPK